MNRIAQLASLAFVVGLPKLALAQTSRYDLGQRLRLMERAWEKATPENRAKAVTGLKKAVPYFFSAKNAEAAATLDDARFVLNGIAEPSDAQRWAVSLFFNPATRLADPADGPVAVKVTPSYDRKFGIPPGALARLTATVNGQALPLAEEGISQLPAKLLVPVNKLPPGDHTIVASIDVGGKRVAESSFSLSLVPGLQSRLDALQVAVRSLPEPKSLARQTARSLSATLGYLNERYDLETDYPAARLLREAEELAQAAAAGRSIYGPDRTGEFWLSVPTSNSEVALRMLVPAGLKADRPVPLVIAMHGAGGSENMFFDAYGDGGTVRMCRERGWLMIATRAGGLFEGGPKISEVTDQLAKLYPIDPKRIYILGHSMGAAQTIAALQASPGKFAAAAALGGGGAVRNPAAVNELPVYVACGAEDFALNGAKNLVRSLERAGAKVTFKEYTAVEHIVIVQAALREMFAFFEKTPK